LLSLQRERLFVIPAAAEAQKPTQLINTEEQLTRPAFCFTLQVNGDSSLIKQVYRSVFYLFSAGLFAA
jgi:hypothetical protein